MTWQCTSISSSTGLVIVTGEPCASWIVSRWNTLFNQKCFDDFKGPVQLWISPLSLMNSWPASWRRCFAAFLNHENTMNCTVKIYFPCFVATDALLYMGEQELSWIKNLRSRIGSILLGCPCGTLFVPRMLYWIFSQFYTVIPFSPGAYYSP